MNFKQAQWLRRSLFAVVLAGLAQGVYADSEYAVTPYAAAWGPSIGTSAPMLSAVDQDGIQQNFASLRESNGLLFVFNRSVDW